MKEKAFEKNLRNLHKVSLTESKYIYDKGVEEIVIGTDQIGYVYLSQKQERFFKRKTAKTKLLPTQKAIKL